MSSASFGWGWWACLAAIMHTSESRSAASFVWPSPSRYFRCVSDSISDIVRMQIQPLGRSRNMIQPPCSTLKCQKHLANGWGWGVYMPKAPATCDPSLPDTTPPPSPPEGYSQALPVSVLRTSLLPHPQRGFS